MAVAVPGTAFKSAVELAEEIKSKRVGCLELLEFFWERTTQFNPALNAIIASDMPAARTRARAADAAIARGQSWGVLHGVPMTIKDSFDVVGMPTTWGLPALKDNRPAQNAPVVDRFLGAGAVIFGKTNVPALLADWQTFNPIHGTCNNPWDVTLSPGGSSGGAAAALAAGLTGLETGSDIGASIRNPAHYCGIYGHKPTYGIVPLRGQVFPGNVAPVDLFVGGPMARSAADLGVALSVIAGPDEIDARGWQLALGAPRQRQLSDFRVAVIYDDPNSEVDVEVQDRLQSLAQFLARSGAQVTEAARPDFDMTEAHATYIRLLRAATSRTQTAEVFRRNLDLAAKLPADDASYYGRMLRANTLYHKDWLDADEARQRIRLKWARFFEDFDLLLCPAAASAACPHDHAGERYQRKIAVNGKLVPTTDQLFWAGIASLVGLPATAAPIGLTPRGLPVGVQIIGRQYDDLVCIAFARLLEQEYCAFTPPPGFSE